MAASGGALVHFEMASLTEEALMHDLLSHVVHDVHSVGMNEQELPNLHSALMHGEFSLSL